MRNDPTYHVLGIPLRTGSLYPGSENDAQAFRDARLLQRLEAAGVRVFDEGDVAVPSYLPHHNIPPYFPHTDGLSMTEARELLAALLSDPRIRIIEVAEYASLRDLDQSYASTIAELLAEALKRPGHLHTNGS